MRAYVHSHCIRPDGGIECLATYQVKWKETPRGYRVLFAGKWRAVKIDGYLYSPKGEVWRVQFSQD